MADGTIKIDIDIPVNKVKSDSHAVNEELERIGKNAGKDMDSSFKKNADSVKREAKSTGESIDKSIGKEHKTKIEVDSSEAKTKINETKHDLDKIPKKHETKVDADASQFNRKVDEAKHKTNELPKKHNTDIDATDHTGGVFARIKSHFDGINERGEKTHSLFKTIFSANVISNAATSAFGAVKGALGGMYQEAKQYALEQQTMNATWLTLTNSASKGRAMVNQINQMAVAAQNSTKMVDELSQKFYAINNNAKQTGQLTKSILTLQDAFGQTDAAVENFGTQFSQMMANGKVSAQDMMSIVNTFPKLRPMLLDYERRIHHSSHMTMQEMNKMMSDGKIKSQDMINVVLEAGKKFNKATGNFTKTIPGMTRVVKSQMPVLLGAFTKPLAKMESPVYAAVAKWVSSKKTNKEFQNLGKTVSTGMNNVMKAFSGGKTVNVTKALDSAINGINKGLKGVFGWISGHAKDLKTIASSIASIGGQLAKAVWKDFASIITTIGNMFGLTAKHGKSSRSAIHVIAEALNSLAKNKTAIKAIADAIVAIAVVKGLDRVGGGLFAIGQKGYKAYRNIKALRAGLKGVQDVKDFSKTEQGFVKIGSAARSAAKWVRGLFSVSKGGAGKLTGLLQSAHSAGGFKNLTTAGKIGTGLAGAGVAVDAGSQFLNAFKDRHNANKRSQDIGKGIGAGIGGGIGLYFGGPLGAALGAKIGGFIGKWGGEGVNQFTKGWQRQGRNKKPQNWVQWLGFQAHNSFDFFAGLGKKAVTAVGKGFNSAKSFAKKNSKELALTAVSPLLGIPALLYKNNPKFRKWANTVGRNVKKGLKTAGKAVNSFKNSLGRKFKKAWDSAYKHSSKGTRQIMRSVSKFAKNYVKTNSKANRATLKNFSSFGARLKKNHGNLFKTLGQTARTQLAIEKRRWSSNWKNIRSAAAGIWKGINRNASDMYHKLNSATHGGLGKVFDGFKSFGKSIAGFWTDLWENVTKTFSDTIKGLKDATNNVGKFFTGKLKVGSLHLAGGTDWQTRWGVPAILNDGNDSPQTNNRESLIYPDGTWELLPDKRNLKRILPFGTDVVNARDTANLASRFMHYAGGTLDLEDLNVSKSQENVLKKLLRINSKQLQVVIEEARRKRDRDRKQAQRQKSKDHKSKKRKPLKITIDNKKRKGSVLVDKGLLTGSLKETGHETWINEKLFKKLMSYTKAKPIKVSKNSRIRYRAIPTRRNSKGQYLVDSKWLTGAKKNTGKLEALTRDAYLKLLQFTKAERKYKLPKKRHKTTTHRRSTTRRRSTRRTSTRRYSTGSSISNVAAHVSASVSGIKSVNALAKAVKAIKGKHKITIKAKASGSKSINKLAKSVKKVAGKHKVTIKTKGLKSLKSLYKAAKRIKGSTHHVTIKTKGASSLNKLRKSISKVASEADKVTKSIKDKGNFAKAIEGLTKKSIKDFKDLNKSLDKYAGSTRKNVSSDFNKLQKSVLSSMKSIRNGVTKSAKDTENGFQGAMKKLIGDAKKDMSGTIDQLNKGISGINTVLRQFGGNKHVIKKAHFATGTDANGRLLQDTLAVVNDAKVGPRQEALVSDKNEVYLPQGNDRTLMIPRGWGVLNGTQTEKLGLSHFAKGSGMSDSALRKLAKNSLKHFAESFNSMFMKNVSDNYGQAVQQSFTGLGKDASNHYGTPWSQAMWQVINNAIGNGAGGTREAFLKYAEEVFTGTKYLMGAANKTLSDCSGMVMQALRHFGIDIGRTTVAMQESSGVQYLGKSLSKTLPGDLVIFGHGTGAAGHVGIIKDPQRGTMFNETPPYARVSKISDDMGMGYGYYRVKGLHNASKKKQPPKALMNLAKKELGSKAIKWIKDHLGEDGMVGAFKLGGDVGDRARAIAKAIKGAMPGATRAGLAAVIGSWLFESGGLNPAAVNPNGGASGLGQWLGPRKTHLMEYARTHGKSWRNPAVQVDFALNAEGADSAALRRILRGHGSPTALATEFSRIWERGGYDAQHAAGARSIFSSLRGFAHGGILSQPETIDVAEGGHPESIIPWDPAYRDRALAIMQATLDHFMAQDGKSQRYQSQAQQAVDLSKTNAEIEAINEKFDAALAQLGILTNKNEVIQLTNTLDKRVIGEAMYAVTKNKLQRDIRNEAYRISGHH